MRVLMLLALLSVLVATSQSHAESRLMGNWLTQYPSEIRSSVVRLVVGGILIKELRFNTPDNLAFLKNKNAGVFNPEAGNARYLTPPEEYLIPNYDKDWYFNGELQISGLKNEDLEGSSELIAYFRGISKEICEHTNKSISEHLPELRIEGIPKLTEDQSALYTKQMVDGGEEEYVLPLGEQPVIASEALEGRPFGCFEEFEGGRYVYYHVLIER